MEYPMIAHRSNERVTARAGARQVPLGTRIINRSLYNVYASGSGGPAAQGAATLANILLSRFGTVLMRGCVLSTRRRSERKQGPGAAWRTGSQISHQPQYRKPGHVVTLRNTTARSGPCALAVSLSS